MVQKVSLPLRKESELRWLCHSTVIHFGFEVHCKLWSQNTQAIGSQQHRKCRPNYNKTANFSHFQCTGRYCVHPSGRHRQSLWNSTAALHVDNQDLHTVAKERSQETKALLELAQKSAETDQSRLRREPARFRHSAVTRDLMRAGDCGMVPIGKRRQNGNIVCLPNVRVVNSDFRCALRWPVRLSFCKAVEAMNVVMICIRSWPAVDNLPAINNQQRPHTPADILADRSREKQRLGLKTWTKRSQWHWLRLLQKLTKVNLTVSNLVLPK